MTKGIVIKHEADQDGRDFKFPCEFMFPSKINKDTFLGPNVLSNTVSLCNIVTV